MLPKLQDFQNLIVASVKVDSSLLGEEDSHEWKFIKPGTQKGLRVVIDISPRIDFHAQAAHRYIFYYDRIICPSGSGTHGRVASRPHS
jgi:hypothetical protein